MPKLKIALKEVEQFVTKVWDSVIFKMPGQRKSKTAAEPTPAPAPVRTTEPAPEPVPVGAAETEEDLYQTSDNVLPAEVVSEREVQDDDRAQAYANQPIPSNQESVQAT